MGSNLRVHFSFLNSQQPSVAKLYVGLMKFLRCKNGKDLYHMPTLVGLRLCMPSGAKSQTCFVCLLKAKFHYAS